MDDVSVSRQMTATTSKSGQDALHLREHWLVLARSSWVVVVTLGLLVALAGSVDSQAFCGRTPCSVFGFSGSVSTLYGLALFVFPAIIWIVLGWVLFLRKSDDGIVWLISLTLVIFGVCSLTDNLIFDANDQTIPGPLLWQIAPYCLYLLKTELDLFSFALFPNGRFVPGWTRWILFIFPVYTLLYLVLPAMHLPGWTIFNNPVNATLWWGCEGSLIAAQFYRYVCRSGPVERQQTKWLLFSFVVIMMADVLNTYIPASLPIPGLSVIIKGILSYSSLVVPVCLMVALLRYRLWEIDILINRTLVYGTLTAILVLTYGSLVFALQSLTHVLTGQAGNNPLLIVASTLVIAALFQPLRRRIQAIIDRRFYRRKYDAAKTLAAFTATLRHEVDLEQLGDELVTVIQETMQPSHVSLWLRPHALARKQREPEY